MSKDIINQSEAIYEDEMEDIEIEEIVAETEEITLPFNLCPVKSTSTSRDIGEAGIISIINSEKNGRRVALSRELLENLNNPEKVQVCFTDTEIAFGEKIPGVSNHFTVKMCGNKGMLYAGKLVQEIAEEFGLDYSNGKTSLTFHNVRYEKVGKHTIAIVTLVDSDDTED